MCFNQFIIGAIFSQEPFLFPWEPGKPTRNSVEYLESRFKEAVAIVKTKEANDVMSDFEWHIHRNWILMETICKRYAKFLIQIANQ